MAACALPASKPITSVRKLQFPGSCLVLFLLCTAVHAADSYYGFSAADSYTVLHSKQLTLFKQKYASLLKWNRNETLSQHVLKRPTAFRQLLLLLTFRFS